MAGPLPFDLSRVPVDPAQLAALQSAPAPQLTPDEFARSLVVDGSAHGATPQGTSQATTADFLAPAPPPTYGAQARVGSQPEAVWMMPGAAPSGAVAPPTQPTQPTLPPRRAPGVRAPASPFGGMAAKAGAQAADATARASEASTTADVAAETYADAVRRGAAAESQAGDAIAGIHEQVAAAQHDWAAQDAIKASAHQQGQARALAELKRDNDKIAAFKVGDNRSAAAKGLGLLAIALGGIGQAFAARGGQQIQNAGLAAVEADIERRLQMQREQLAQMKGQRADKIQELSAARELYSDAREQDQFARALMLRGWEQSIEAAKARGLAPKQLAAADETIAALQLKRNDALAQLHDERAQRFAAQETGAQISQYQERRQAAAAAAAAPYTAAKRALELGKLSADTAKTEAEAAKLRGEVSATAEGPFLGAGVVIKDRGTFAAWNRSKPAAAEQEKLRVAVQGHAKFNAAIRRIEELKSQYGAEYLPTDAAAEMDMQREQAIAGANEMKDGSVINASEYVRWLELIPGASDMGVTAMPKLKAMRAASYTRLNAQLRQLGAELKPDPSEITRKGAR